MFRRALTGLVFCAVLGLAGVGMVNKANAHGGDCGYRDYYGGYAQYNGYRGVYYGGYPRVFPSPYVAGYTYAPPVVFYPERRGHRHHRHYRDYGRGGITVAFGF